MYEDANTPPPCHLVSHSAIQASLPPLLPLDHELPDEWSSLPPQRPPPHTAHKTPPGAGASQQALTCGSPSPGPPSQAHGVCLGPGRWVSMELVPRSVGVQLENHTKAEELEDPVHGVPDVGGVVFQAEDEELLLVKDGEPV